MPTPTGNLNHDAAVLAAESAQQAALATALLGGQGVTTVIVGPTGPTPLNGQALFIRAANIAFQRACLASATANGVTPAPYIQALQSLGVSVYP